MHSPSWSPRSGAPHDPVDLDDDAFSAPEDVRYEPGGLLGRGGWGEVRAAHDRRLARVVAVKVPRLDDAQSRDDLLREARLTARLDHPNIIAVHDAGTDAQGRPYYTMPVLGGRSLAEALQRAETLGQRLRLVRHLLDAAHAIAYAHSQGVLHRDLKPDNVMVGSYGQTLVTDWGLACTTAEAAASWHPPIGTPGYMSPEAGSGAPLDARTDVYGLGAILYTLLAGRAPPLAPAPPVRAAAPRAPAPLAAIADRALATDLTARYPDAIALAADLEAWFDDRPVAAHQYTIGEEVGRRLRRWRVPILVGAAAAIGIFVAGAFGWRATLLERDHARAAEDDALAARADSERSLTAALAAHARQAASSGDQAAAEVLAAEALAHGPSPDALGVLARYAGFERVTLVDQLAIDGCDLVGISDDRRYAACNVTEGIAVRAVDDPTVLARITARWGAFVGRTTEFVAPTEGGLVGWRPGEAPRTLDGTATAALVSSDPVTGVTTVTSRGLLQIYDPRRGLVRPFRRCGTSAPNAAVPLSDGRVAVACLDGAVGFVDADGSFDRLGTVDIETGVPTGVGVAADLSGRVAIGTARGTVVVLDGRTGGVLQRLPTGPNSVHRVALLGARLAAVSADGTVWVWDLQTGDVLAQIDAPGAQVTWLDGGRLLRLVGPTLTDWRVPASAPLRAIEVAEGVTAVSVAPAGDRIAIAAGDGHTRVIRVADRAPLADLHWQAGVTKDVAFSPDGERLAIGVVATNGTRVYDARAWSLEVELPGPGARRVGWLPDGSLLTLAYAPGIVRWTATDRRWERTVLAPEGMFHEMEVDGRGEVALIDRNGTLWRRRGDAFVAIHSAAARGLAAAPFGEGTFLANAVLDLVDAQGASAGGWGELSELPADIAVSPDGRYVAIGTMNGAADLWSIRDRALVARFTGHRAKVSTVEFTADGRQLWTGSWDHTARVWDVGVLDAPATGRAAALQHDWGLTVAAALERVTR